ncbi:MAG: hypothetical protein QXI10_01360 [Candidatus Diapherotrites archaeon]
MRGNAVALVIIGLLVAVVVLVTLQSTPVVPSVIDPNSSQKVVSEVKISLEKATKDSVADLMRNGFSESGDPWFLNGLNVPSIEGFKNSVSSVAENNLENTLNDLSRARGYNFSNKSISVVSSNNTLQARAEVIASVKDGDIQKDFKIDNSFDLWPEALEMHSKMSEWSPEMANFNKEVAELIDSLGYCKLAQCNCTFVDNTPINTSEKIDSAFFSANDFRPKLDALLSQKIARLNEKFVDSGISCRYEYKDLVIDRDITYEQVCFGIEGGWTRKDAPPMSIIALQEHWCATQRFRVSDEPNFSIWWEMLEQKFPGKIMRSKVEGFNEPISLTTNKFSVCGNLTTKDGGYTDERIVVNPKAYVDVAVICENPKVSINGPSGIEPLKSQARFVAAVRQQCAINDLRKSGNDRDTVEPACLGKSTTPIVKCHINSDCIPDKLEDFIVNDKDPYSGVCVSIPGKEPINCKLECDKSDAGCNTSCTSYKCVKDARVPPDLLREGYGVCDILPILNCKSNDPCNPSYCDESNGGCVSKPYCSRSTELPTCGAEQVCTIDNKGKPTCTVKLDSIYTDCTAVSVPNCKVLTCVAKTSDNITTYSCGFGQKECPPVNSIPYFCDPADGICKPQYIG